MNIFTYPLMSEMSDWFAVPGHIPKSKALKQLMCEGLLDWLVDEVEIGHYRECADCEGEGCEWCDFDGEIKYTNIGWRNVMRRMRHGYVKRDPDRPNEDWWKECTDLDVGALPATILDL